jgi:RimJ/RimL family protein N-acetyltransferase
MELNTQRLFIREFVSSDINALTELRLDPKYVEMMPWDNHSEEYSKKLVDDFILWQSESPRKKYHLAICHESKTNLIGTTGIHIKSFEHREAELALYLSVGYWGKGFSEEIGQVMLNFAFHELNLHRIAAETLSENKRAINLCYKLGMVNEGKFRQNKFYNNRWYDSIRFSILKDEWNDTSSEDNR